MTTAMRLFLFLILLGIVSRAPAEVLPALFTGKGLRVQLVSDRQVIKAGETFHLGLWIQHEPGYHTYWQNPGLAGVPTKLVPELPPGFTSGILIYPPPDKVKMAAIRVHGYENDVLIALPITAPAVLPAGPLNFPIEATWMCCQRTCNPGHARLSLTLATASSSVPDAAWDSKFQELKAAQPPALTGWTAAARLLDKEVELTLTPPAAMALPAQPQFVSSDNLICSHPPQLWQQDGTGYRVRLTLSDFPPQDPSTLRGLLFGQGTWLPGQAAPYVSVAIPLIGSVP